MAFIDSWMRYGTADETRFISELAARTPETAVQYCRLVLTQPRRWDETVDVGEVKRHARLVLQRLTMPAVAPAHPAVLEGAAK